MKLFIFALICVSITSATVFIDPFGDEGACGDDQPRYINDPSVVFTSPNFGEGERYPPNQDCTWLIEYTGDNEETSIEIEISRLQTEECIDCACDYLEAFDGNTTVAPSLGRRCGNDDRASFVTDNQIMLLRFASDASTEFAGFSASPKFSVLPPAHCVSGGAPLVFTEAEGEVVSPGYEEGQYPPNMNCQWQLNVPGAQSYILQFEDFETEDNCNGDYMKIFSDSTVRRGRWFGNQQPGQLEIVGNVADIEFVTDSSINLRGFVFQYTAVF